jgi:hypothetical protein
MEGLQYSSIRLGDLGLKGRVAGSWRRHSPQAARKGVMLGREPARKASSDLVSGRGGSRTNVRIGGMARAYE